MHHPVELDKATKKGEVIENATFDMAQEEIAQNSGFNMDKTGGKSKGLLHYLLSSPIPFNITVQNQLC